MNNEILEKQAWHLYYKLSQLAYAQSILERSKPELITYQYRKLELANRAFNRWVRRENKLFNYNPDGFARPLSSRPV